MLQALKSHHGNVRAATREVGIGRNTHYNWMQNDSVYRNQAMAYTLIGSKMHKDRTRTEKRLMIEALKKNHCNVRKATKEVGISVFKHYDWIGNDEAYKSIVWEISDNNPHGIKTRKRMMLEALTINNGVVRDAAQQAGIGFKTHYDWMRIDKDYRSKSLQRKKTNGYVYLIHCKETTFYKIGISKNSYGARLSQIQSCCPFELEMVHVIHSVNYLNLEKELHYKFKDKRVRGEWFDLDQASLNTVMKYLQDAHQSQMQIDFKAKDHK